MRVRAAAFVLVMGVAWSSVLEEGPQAQSSCSSAADCNDGNSCTQDACESGACANTANGSCAANPKTLGYWRRVCRGNGNTGEFLTGADVQCVRDLECHYYVDAMLTVADVCDALTLSRDTGQDADCNNGYEQLIALKLNLCRGRLTESQEAEFHCGSGGSFRMTVGNAALTAGQFLCADHNPFSCSTSLCVVKAINQGHALRVSGLRVSKLSTGGLRLVWTPPLADTEALTATPRRYRVWRASGAGTTFVQIAEVADPSFDDRSAEGVHLRYEVTPVW